MPTPRRSPSSRWLRASLLAGPSLLLPAVAVVLMHPVPVSAQSDVLEKAVSAEERSAVVERIGEMLNERYVFPDVAESCAEHLRRELGGGVFDDVTDPAAFATRLTESLQSVSHDKHMHSPSTPPERATMEQANPARAQADRLDRMRQQNFGFEKLQRFDGNVGYLDLRYFAGAPEAQATGVAAMNFLANADAVIFDMRMNGGGSPDMVRFLCSYLFDEPTHLNSLYWREGDVTREFWTLDDVPGPKMPDVPVFVLTSERTFSGAEEFSYNLRTQKRATLVGETTGGGANPGGTAPVNQQFEIFIPTGRAINPITGINWEGTGVEPHVAVDADAALDTALELAVVAAEGHRADRAERVAAVWSAFSEGQTRAVSLADEGKTDKAVSVLASSLGDARSAGIVGEMDLNMLGYQFAAREQAALAIATFEFNVAAYPESSNVYDSLGEAYMNDGQVDLAIENYRKSLELDPGNENARAMIAAMRKEQ